jgi:hypothetical protein
MSKLRHNSNSHIRKKRCSSVETPDWLVKPYSKLKFIMKCSCIPPISFLRREVITGEETLIVWVESEKANAVEITAGSDSGRDTRRETK